MKYTRKLTLDVALLSGTKRIVTAKQDDTERYINILLTSNRKPIRVAEDSIVTLRGTLPDGTAFEELCTINGNGTVSVRLTDEMLKIIGEYIVDILVTSETGATLSSADFKIRVIKTAVGDSSNTIKLGKGLIKDSDGAIAIDSEYVATSDDLVDEEEVKEEIDEILENKGEET